MNTTTINLADYARQYIDAKKQWSLSYEEDMRDQEGTFWRMTSSRTDTFKQWMEECYESLLAAAAILGVSEADADQLVFNIEHEW